MKKYKNTKASRNGLEVLEDRRLLSSVALTGGNLKLVGDANQNNSFLVRAAPSNRVLGFSNNFGRVASLSDIQTVVIYTGNSTDTVTVGAGVTTPVEVIGPDGTISWVKAGTSNTFGAVSGGDSAGSGSTGSGSSGNGSGSTGSSTGSSGSGSTGSGTGSSGSGSGSSGSGTGSSGSGSGSSGSGTGSSGSGSGSSGSGTGSSGSGSGSTGSGTGSSGSGSGSTGSGTGSSGSGSGSSGSGTGSSGSGSGSTGSGTGSSGSGSGSTGSGTGSTGSGSGSAGTGSGSAGAGASGTGTTGNPSNPSDSATPKAVLTLTSPSTVLPQESVNVKAINSSFGSGTVLNSTIAWNFGDAGSHYNTIVGFNAAHAYANAGTYTITLTITTPDGHVGVATQQITISPDNRPTIYVAANGSDSNDGSSASAPIQSLSRLNQLLTSNVRVLFHDGDTFDLTASINLGGLNHVYLGSYGSGAKPILMFTGKAGNGNFVYLSATTKSVVVQGLTFDSIYPDDRDSEAIFSAFTMIGNDITIRDNTFLNVLNDMGGTSTGATNVLVQDNTSPLATGLSEYFYFMGGVGNSDIVVIGNQVADSTHEAVLRIGGSSDILIADNNFTELTADLTTVPGGKNVLSIQEGSYAYIYNNVLNTGPVELGPIGTPAADPNGIFQYAVFDSNLLANGGSFNINPNAKDAMYKNNVVLATQKTGFTINAEQDIHSVHWQVQNIWIENNTVTDPAGPFAGFLSINNGEAAGIHVDNNLFVDPGIQTGSYSGFIKDDADMNSFAEIKDNIWSVPSGPALAQSNDFYIASNGGWLTPAQWEATGVPTGDVYENVNLGATYSVSAGGFNAGSNLPTS